MSAHLTDTVYVPEASRNLVWPPERIEPYVAFSMLRDIDAQYFAELTCCRGIGVMPSRGPRSLSRFHELAARAGVRRREAISECRT
jgi:hypothetical protein